MDLEGNLILDRRPARRWVSAVAVVIPVVACVAGATWFVRTFIAPPTITIPGSLMLASTTPAPLPSLPSRAEPAAAKLESVWPTVVMPPTPTGSSTTASAQQAAAVFGPATPASNAFPAPPQSTRVATTAFTDPARDNPAAAPAAEAAAMPIAGRIPLPRRRPPMTAVAAAAHPASTPRAARPAEEEAAPAASPTPSAEPAYDRHAVD